MKIILDARGGDNAPEAPVLGAVEAAKAYGIEIVLVGRGEDILAVLKKHGIDNLPEGMEISNALKEWDQDNNAEQDDRRQHKQHVSDVSPGRTGRQPPRHI